MTQAIKQQHPAIDYIDLLSERIGGRAIACSDDWFASCENLVKPGRGIFKEGHFVSTGQWMDGWESRRGFGRKREGDHDWCILRLGVQGIIRALDIDTNHFRGNAPEQVSVQAANISAEPDQNTQWTTILDKSDVDSHSQNIFDCDSNEVWTHLKLIMHPDGGIARFRAYGEVFATNDNYIEGELVDLASVTTGSRGIAASDMFYSSPSNLTMPGRGINMGDGWETRRRRDEFNDWAIIKFGLSGTIRKVLVDTAHFKGNFPDRFSLQAVNAITHGINDDNIQADTTPWESVIAETKLYADREHLFINRILVDPEVEFTHVRLNIYPDGGVSRLRVWGFPNWGAPS